MYVFKKVKVRILFCNWRRKYLYAQHRLYKTEN